MIRIIDFYADWCGPCKRLKPILQEIEKESHINIEYVDVDVNVKMTEEYGVSSLPALFFEKDGEIVHSCGFTTKEKLIDKIELYLK